MKLVDRHPRRIFTFGCSFTEYRWPMWPQMIALDLGIPLWNYGRAGSGNQRIFNSLMQADCLYKFNADDLVMICWTNVCREDRFRNRMWVSPGNIFTQEVYDEKYIENWAHPTWYMLRDYATIKATAEWLESKPCQHHMMSMCDVFNRLEQYNDIGESEDKSKIYDMYKPTIDKILPSFYDVLWNNDLGQSITERRKIHHLLNDFHPLPTETQSYLEKTFDHKFKDQTIEKIEKSQKAVAEFVISTGGNPGANVPVPILLKTVLGEQNMIISGFY